MSAPIVRFINVYRRGPGSVCFESLIDAGACANPGRIGTVKLVEAERSALNESFASPGADEEINLPPGVAVVNEQ